MFKLISKLLLVIVLSGTIFISGISCSNHSAWNITDIAIGPDGDIIYMIASKYNTDTVAVYKSTDSGTHFTVCTMPAGFTAPARLVAVAPDNPDMVAVIDSKPAVIGVSEGGTLWRSKTGGQAWEAFPPVPNTSAVASTVIADIAIGPSRIGMVFGRNYMVCSRDTVEGITGRTHTIGTGDNWEDMALCFPIYPMDFTSCRFSPNFSVDRCIVTVGSSTEDTFQDIINISSNVSITHVLLEPSGIDSPGDTQIVTSDIAFPSDYNPTSPIDSVSFVGWYSNPYTGDDVYRVNGASVIKLNFPDTTGGIRSIVYSGTIKSGKLLVGMQANTGVYSTTNPVSDSSKWEPVSVPPDGERTTILSLAPNLASTSTYYAGTSGTGSGFFISTDGGNTFH